MTEIQARKYEINSNCRRIHSDEGAIDIALKGIKEEFLHDCKFEANDNAKFYITLVIDRPNKKD